MLPGMSIGRTGPDCDGRLRWRVISEPYDPMLRVITRRDGVRQATYIHAEQRASVVSILLKWIILKELLNSLENLGSQSFPQLGRLLESPQVGALSRLRESLY